MNNEPVAWMEIEEGGITEYKVWREPVSSKSIPLYTHPVKEQKCVVQGCENHKHEGSFNGDLCSPCYQFIAHGEGVYSQAYRNAKPAKLTDKEIGQIYADNLTFMVRTKEDANSLIDCARAILRKAQEK